MLIFYSRYSQTIFHQGWKFHFFLQDFKQIWKGSGYLVSLPKKGHHETISTLLEASSMLWWDEALPQWSALVSTREGKGAAELLRVAQHRTQHVATHRFPHAPGTTAQPKWALSARTHQECWVLVWSYIQCLCLSQHTLCTLNTHTASWLICPVLTEPSLLLSFEGYGCFL